MIDNNRVYACGYSEGVSFLRNWMQTKDGIAVFSNVTGEC